RRQRRLQKERSGEDPAAVLKQLIGVRTGRLALDRQDILDAGRRGAAQGLKPNHEAVRLPAVVLVVRDPRKLGTAAAREADVRVPVVPIIRCFDRVRRLPRDVAEVGRAADRHVDPAPALSGGSPELNRAGSGLDGHAARGTRRRGGGRRWLDVTQDHRGDARHDRDGLRRRGELRPARLLTACGERRNQTDGGGMPADAAAPGIREVDANGTIGLVGAEPHPPYNRPPLSKALWKGDPEESIWRKTAATGAQLTLGRRVTAIDPRGHTATDDRGTVYRFEKLLLATGGLPRRLPAQSDAVIYFRTLEDYRRLRALAGQSVRCAVIGRGFMG